MALTTPRGFAGGPMADIDYGMVAARAAWVEESGHLTVTQPNTGTRTVSIAPGTADGWGIRVQNDAAVSQALAAPGSGGAWYLIALRRDWSAKTCSLQVLAGPTSGSTTAPATVPTTLPGTFQNTPGTQADQPLAWVWASSATTTLTVFDVRCQDNRGRGVQAVNLHALAVLALTALQNGANIAPRVTVGAHTLPSGQQVQTIDAIGNGYGAFVLTGRVFTNGTPTLAGMGADLTAQITAYSGLIFGEGQTTGRVGLLFTDLTAQANADYAWNGTGWALVGADITPGVGVNGGIGFPGTVTNFGGGYTTRATRSGTQVTATVHVNVGSNGLAVGATFMSLPAGFRPTAVESRTLLGFDADGTGFGGPSVNVLVNTDGTVTYQGIGGKAANTSAYPANKSLFGVLVFRGA